MNDSINSLYKSVRATVDSAGYDIYTDESIDIKAGEIVEIVSSFRLTKDMKMFVNVRGYEGEGKQNREYVDSWFGMIVPRSSLGTKYGLRLLNTVGIADQDYLLPMMFTITVEKDLHLDKGERFVQIIYLPRLIRADEEVPTKIRDGGYGHTGKK